MNTLAIVLAILCVATVCAKNLGKHWALEGTALFYTALGAAIYVAVTA